MSRFREVMSLDVKAWLKAKLGDTAYDIAGIVVRMIASVIVVLFALLMIKARTIF